MASAAEIRTDLHIFWAKGCLHCENALEFLRPLPQSYPGLVIHAHEVSENQANLDLLIRIASAHDIREVGVPLLVLGDDVMVGFGESSGPMLRSQIEACRQINCQTRLEALPKLSHHPINPASTRTISRYPF